jgi:hypothetical protein
MTEKKIKLPSFITPKGIFVWPRLTEPDTKYKAEGLYSVKLRLDEADAKTLITKLQPIFDASVAEGKEKYAALPVKTRKEKEFKTVKYFSPVYDEQTEEETGEIEFNFKMTASGVSKKTGKPWSRKPRIFDAKGKPMVTVPSIWGGTLGKVAFEVMPFFNAAQCEAGLSLRLDAAQIIELVSGGGKSASAYGFGEEDGYEHEEDSFESVTESDRGSAGGAEDDQF